MKKIIYIAIIVIVGSLAFTSCTEENVKPAASTGSESGSPSEDPIKGS